MLRSESMEELNRLGHKVIRSGEVRNRLLSFGMLIILLVIAYGFYVDRVTPRIRRIEIQSLTRTSPSTVCPGDMLTANYVLLIEGQGVIVRDTSVQQLSPASTIIFSDMLRAPVIGPLQERVTLAYQVPEEYYDYRTGNFVKLLPGSYLQNIAISSTGRNALSDIKTLEFDVGTEAYCDSRKLG